MNSWMVRQWNFRWAANQFWQEKKKTFFFSPIKSKRYTHQNVRINCLLMLGWFSSNIWVAVVHPDLYNTTPVARHSIYNRTGYLNQFNWCETKGYRNKMKKLNILFHYRITVIYTRNSLPFGSLCSLFTFLCIWIFSVETTL